MIPFLAFIGLIFLLWLLSKGLKKFGNLLESLSVYLSDQSLSRTRTRLEDKEISDQLKKIEKNIKEIKNENYLKDIREEINDLTKES